MSLLEHIPEALVWRKAVSYMEEAEMEVTMLSL